MNVLILDDERLIREVLAEFLGQLGHRSSATANGHDALAAYERGMAGGDPFNLVIVDLHLDGGDMDGVQTAQRLLALDPAATLIVSTGLPDDPVALNFLHHGFAGCLCKPYRLNHLVQILDEVSQNMNDNRRISYVQAP